MNRYHYKLYALLKSSKGADALLSELSCLASHLPTLVIWWQQQTAENIASASDRLNLATLASISPHTTACHPISGQTQSLTASYPTLTKASIRAVIGEPLTAQLFASPSAKTVFFWFWRFAPEIAAQQNPDALLHPAHIVLPDCPIHSYQSTVSAIAGATLSSPQDTATVPPDTAAATEDNPAEPPDDTINSTQQTPYLLLFSFSPVQEFIKASRKFLDFWAGSYLLHYLSVKLCWEIANTYGPDAIIVPSLWSQEGIDALMAKPSEPALFRETFAQLGDRLTPSEKFKQKKSNSLNTAGFPNMITALVPGKAAAQVLGDRLSALLTQEWQTIAKAVEDHVRTQVVDGYLAKASDRDKADLLSEVFPTLSPQDLAPYVGYEADGKHRKGDLEKLQTLSCWEWPALWKAQIQHTWEPYWSAVPLGHPQAHSTAQLTDSHFADWAQQQQQIAHSPTHLTLPSPTEKALYTQTSRHEYNVGSWWGSFQRRLQVCLQAAKNTRSWQIPAAPGERSTLSGQFSALHPWLNWRKFQEGAGLPEGSMRLFWAIMSKAYPGLFNGSERLNALELTKRMAWTYGGVAADLGIEGALQPPLPSETQTEDPAAAAAGAQEINEYDFETQIRFPNLSSIAAARFLQDCPHLAAQYWQALNQQIKQARQADTLSVTARRAFYAKTRRDPQIASLHTSPSSQGPSTNTPSAYTPSAYNGVMFSSKWLADDMGLLPQLADSPTTSSPKDSPAQLREMVAQAHQQVKLSGGSPADWWAIVLADGDNMGQFVSGKRLQPYSQYVQSSELDLAEVDAPTLESFLNQTTKRMGPATHVGLNRALLDFSNRLVPYLSERRFCGRVIYSGGDDVMSVLPLEDLPEYLLSLRAAWSGKADPYTQTGAEPEFSDRNSGYWHPNESAQANGFSPMRPQFTMGRTATMSIGVVIAYKTVPLPTVLESLWEAEGDRAKGMPGKNGLCFRVIYGNGNQLEALMSGQEIEQEVDQTTDLLSSWWAWVNQYIDYAREHESAENLSPLLLRLAEELPKRATVGSGLFAKAARVLMERRDRSEDLSSVFDSLEHWLSQWETWAAETSDVNTDADEADADGQPLGTTPEDLGKLLRFSAFWIDKRVERLGWQQLSDSLAEQALAQEAA